jgi:hypothetical protein
VLGERLQAPGVRGAEEQAQRGVLAAADPPAQLVQLGDPVAVGVLHEHHGGVRHVDAHLDDRRGHEHVGLPGGEGLHRRRLVPRGELAVQERHRKSASSVVRRRSYSAVAARA